MAAGFERAPDGTRCRILLDAVRHWGPESAHRVLDLYESRPLPSIVGFGLGGDEASYPAAAFADVYLRARGLGLRTSVHAGEWAGASSVAEALDALRPDRIDHGIAAASDARLLRRLAEEGTVLCVAPSSNRVTRAVPSLAAHPLSRLLAAGVRVAIAADDPLFFDTTTRREYGILRGELGVSRGRPAALRRELLARRVLLAGGAAGGSLGPRGRGSLTRLDAQPSVFS